MPSIDYLVLGHVAKDIAPDGHTIGGTVTYSAVTAQRLGLNAAIVTAADRAFGVEVQAALPGIAVHTRISAQSTTFQNTYTDGGRVQSLLGHADCLTLGDVPEAWRSAHIVHLGPVAQEVDTALARQFPGSLVALTPQGWLRQWDGTGRVRMRLWDEAPEILPHVDVLVLSEEDLNGNAGLMDEYARLTRIAVLTQGPRGCVVFTQGMERQIPGFPVPEVDPTGAGDVFAAAFLVRLQERQDPFQAARFANATASFCVQAPGVTGIPTRAQVEERLSEFSI